VCLNDFVAGSDGVEMELMICSGDNRIPRSTPGVGDENGFTFWCGA